MPDQPPYQGLPEDWNHGSHAAREPFSSADASDSYGAEMTGSHRARTTDGYGTGPADAHSAAGPADATTSDVFGTRADPYATGKPDAFGARPDSHTVGKPDAFGARADSYATAKPDAFGARPDPHAAGKTDAFGARPDPYAAGKPDAFGARADSYATAKPDAFGARPDSHATGKTDAFGIRSDDTYGAGAADRFRDADPFGSRTADPFGPPATGAFGTKAATFAPATADAGTARADAERPPGMIGDQAPGEAADPRGFLGALFDFGFTSFVTPKVIRVLYMLIVAGTVLSALAFTVIAFKASVLIGILTLVFGDPLFILIVLAIYRVLLEFFVVTFRVAEDVRAMRERGDPR